MRTMRLTLLALCLLSLGVMVSCEPLDKATGTNVAAGTADPNGGTIGTVLRTADGFIPPEYNFIAKLLLAGVTLYQTLRLKTATKEAANYELSDSATAAALRDFMRGAPEGEMKELADKLYDAHVASGVDPAFTVDVVNKIAPPQ